MNMADYSECPGCKARLPITGYPADNRYGVFSAECRQAFDEILVKEQELFGYPAVHRLIVDSYWVQHPPHEQVQKNLCISPRFVAASIQSVAVHLIALHCALDKKIELSKIPAVMDRILTRMSALQLDFPYLKSPDDLGVIRAFNVRDAVYAHPNINLHDYEQYAWDWARAAYDSWRRQHDLVAQWYVQYGQ